MHYGKLWGVPAGMRRIARPDHDHGIPDHLILFQEFYKILKSFSEHGFPYTRPDRELLHPGFFTNYGTREDYPWNVFTRPGQKNQIRTFGKYRNTRSLPVPVTRTHLSLFFAQAVSTAPGLRLIVDPFTELIFQYTTPRWKYRHRHIPADIPLSWSRATS